MLLTSTLWRRYLVFQDLFPLAVIVLDSLCGILFAVSVFVCDDAMSLLVCTLFSRGFHLVRRVILFDCGQRTWVTVRAVILHKHRSKREPLELSGSIRYRGRGYCRTSWIATLQRFRPKTGQYP